MVRRDITERLVTPISSRRSTALYEQSDVAYDVSIDGMPFFLAISPERPATRSTKEVQKSQFDTSKEPGEQSLSQWWVRAQDSWHRGAGLEWYEPGADDQSNYRCGRAVGIDVWTKGEVKLHKAMTRTRPVSAGQGAWCSSVVANGTDSIMAVENGVLTRVSRSGTTTYSGGFGSLTGAPAVCGGKVVVGASGGLHIGDVTGSALTQQVTATGVFIPWWVKSRLIVSNANRLYEMTLSSTSIPTGALYTHPDSNWVWTSVVETPDAILAAGFSNGNSAVFAYTLTSGGTGTTPVLGGAAQVVELPPGETVHSMRVYLGAYIAVGTSRGVRIGLVQQGGNITLGPLTVESVNPVRSITARDTYFLAAIENDIDGFSGCARIDLSQEIETLRYAWAYDAQTHITGKVFSVALLGNSDSVCIAVEGSGIWIQSLTQYEASGYFTTGKIRYATTVPKIFAFVQLRSTLGGDSGISLSTIDIADGDETFAFRFGPSYNDDNDVQLPTINSARYALDLKVTLEASTDRTVSPVLTSVAVKALPQPKVQREVVWWVSCFDREEDRMGNKVGTTGSAWERYSRLEWIEDTRTAVFARDFRTNEGFLAWVDRIDLVQTKPPAKNETNWGGYVKITLTRL